MSRKSLRPPRKVFFELTRACNLACTYCQNNAGSLLSYEMSMVEILETVCKLAVFGLSEIRFTGGEPTIHPALMAAIELAKQSGIYVSIGTNAISITPTYAKQLARVGLQKAIVSVEGDKQSHDAVCGAGSFRRAWRGIRALRASDVEVRVNAVAMKTNQKALLALARLCGQEDVRLFVRRFIPSGRANGNFSELVTATEYEILRLQLLPFIQRGVVDGHYLNAGCHNCSAGDSGFVILPDGRVQSCGFLSELGENSYGNVRHEELLSIWRRVTQSRFLAEKRTHLILLPDRHPELPVTNCMAMAAVSDSASFRQTGGDQHEIYLSLRTSRSRKNPHRFTVE